MVIDWLSLGLKCPCIELFDMDFFFRIQPELRPIAFWAPSGLPFMVGQHTNGFVLGILGRLLLRVAWLAVQLITEYRGGRSGNDLMLGR